MLEGRAALYRRKKMVNRNFTKFSKENFKVLQLGRNKSLQCFRHWGAVLGKITCGSWGQQGGQELAMSPGSRNDHKKHPELHRQERGQDTGSCSPLPSAHCQTTATYRSQLCAHTHTIHRWHCRSGARSVGGLLSGQGCRHDVGCLLREQSLFGTGKEKLHRHKTSLEVFKTWLDKAPNNLFCSHNWPCLEHVVH